MVYQRVCGGKHGDFSLPISLNLEGFISLDCTPWKINMEPTNHPLRKENDLNQTSMIMCKMLIFRGVSQALDFSMAMTMQW